MTHTPEERNALPQPHAAPAPIQPYNQPQGHYPPPQHFQQPPFMGQPVRQPDHKSRLVWHLVFLLLIEPIVLGTLVFITGVTLIFFPIAVLFGLAWIGLGVWHIIAVILAIIGLGQQQNQPPYYR